MAAFDHALALGADGLELDVHLARDGVVVVHHDATLERTTNGRGAIASCTAAQLRELDAGYWFTGPDADGGFPFRNTGVHIPTLASVLSRYPGVPLLIELKGQDVELARHMVALVRSARAEDRVACGSFSRRLLREVRRAAPEVRTGASHEETRWALYRSWAGCPVRRTPYREFQIPERSGRTTIVTPRFVAHAHRAGVAVKVWTVDEPADIDRLLDWGVDAIISDRPDVAVPAVAARRRPCHP